MQLNQDYHLRVTENIKVAPWRKSPSNGVERIFLERDGEENAKATSFVRYAAKSHFSEHIHEGGEEIFVLDGTFADEHGEYPKGSYIRNPIGTHHSPFSDTGCLLFVKLKQFDPADNERSVVNTKQMPWHQGMVSGLSVMPLHQFGTQHTALVRWQPNTVFTSHQHWGGEEILVLEGVFRDDFGEYPEGSWIRSPHLSRHRPYTGAEGAIILVKTGHLEF